MNARNRLIVALDTGSEKDVDRITAAVGDYAGIFKVGKQLFTSHGPDTVRRLVKSGRQVFLDLKFHDIPHTVAGAVGEASRLGVAMLTVHAAGGAAMLRAAVQAAREGPGAPPLILAVTVLTSLTDKDLEQTGVNGRVAEQVLRLASLAINEGCGGVVASAQEAAYLRQKLGTGFVIVTPGVRPSGAPAGDQARVVTPGEALRAGATHIVVGRPITESPDPGMAARTIVEEIASVIP